MTVRLAVSLASSMADAVTAAVDSGSGAGTLKVYTGSKPATVETAASGTLLATFTLTDPAAAGAVSGVSTLDFDQDLLFNLLGDHHLDLDFFLNFDGDLFFDNLFDFFFNHHCLNNGLRLSTGTGCH